MIASHLRFAAAVCVLAAGLLMGAGGGAVAVADPAPDSSGSAATGDAGPTAAGHGSTAASNPVGNVVGNVADTLRKTLQGVTSTLGSGRLPRQQPAAESPKSEPAAAPQSETKGSGVVAGTDPVPAAPDVVVPVPDAVPVNDVVAPVPDVVAAPVPDVVAPAPTVVTPVPTVVTPVPTVVTPVPNVVVWVPILVAPISDVIAAVQHMLTSAAGAVAPLTKLQSDLSSLFGIVGAGPGGDGSRGGLSAAAGASVAPKLPLVYSLAGVPARPLAGNAAGAATLEGTGASSFGAPTQVDLASSPPWMAPVARNGAIPRGVRSFLQGALSGLLLPVSLSALAGVALPGVGGILILIGAGVRVGYRQAKAGCVLRTAGIAHFARPAPLGVVRSGPLGVVGPDSVVVARPRTLRVARPAALSAECLLDEAA
ncbi:MAG: hypothetical protein JWR37_2203 [Mycobacterium sp.]|nr:hypothetical protein [Mycobacterium sp.]